MTNQKRESFLLEVKLAELLVVKSKNNLAVFDALAENNVYDTVEIAEDNLHQILQDRAFEDCEGAGNCGLDEYRQEFLVDGKKYIAILGVEYNRHDKTYYYIDGTDFCIEPVV